MKAVSELSEVMETFLYFDRGVGNINVYISIKLKFPFLTKSG